MRITLIISFVLFFHFGNSQDFQKIDSLLSNGHFEDAKNEISPYLYSKDKSTVVALNTRLVYVYLNLNEERKAMKSARKVFNSSEKIKGVLLNKTIACQTLANFYYANKDWKKAAKWKNLRMNKYNYEFCGVGKVERLIDMNKELVIIYEKLNKKRIAEKYKREVLSLQKLFKSELE